MRLTVLTLATAALNYELTMDNEKLLVRPACFEFAMSFLGGSEETEIRTYIAALEDALQEKADSSMVLME